MIVLMSDGYLFVLLSLQARHLAVRQATIAGNVANANTRNYKTRDVTPFSQVLARTSLEMTTTEKARTAEPDAGPTGRAMPTRDNWDVLESASGVSLEQEMLKASEVSRDHTLNINIGKAFDRMLKLATKS